MNAEEYSKEELWSMVTHLQNELQAERKQRKACEADNQEKDFHLRERRKELEGIYSITRLINGPSNSISHIIKESLKILTDSYLYPEITCGSITYGKKAFYSPNFKQTPWKQSIELKIFSDQNLKIEIFYLEEKPELNEGPFLREERELLNTIGRELAVFLRRKLLQDELKKKNQNFEVIFNSVKDAVFIHDQNGLILEVNPEACRRLKYTREEFFRMTPYDIDDPMHVEKIPQVMEEILSKGYYQGETVHVTKDNEKIPTELNTNLVKFENKIMILTVARDITNRKKYEDELLRSKQLAEEANLLKSAFLANLSHEIRTPLNGIMGFSEMMDNKELSDEKRKEYSKYIKESGARLITIVDDILDISFIETGQVQLDNESFSINNLIDMLALNFQQTIKDLGKDISLKMSKALPNGKDLLISDQNKLYKIFSKLLDNAVKYTENGSIEIGYTLGQNGKMSCYVKDTGIGVPEDGKKKIFQMFRQYDEGITRRYEGLGLGLSIVHGLVYKLGGEIEFDSEEMKGTNIRFHIPLTAQEEKISEIENHETEKDLTGKTILIAEDEVSHFELMKAYFEEYNINVFYAENGFDAVETFTDLQNVDLVFMDIQMPGMDGMSACRQIKEVNNEIPVIALTVYAHEDDRKKFLKMGFDGYLSKPVEFGSLMKITKQLIR